MPPAFRCQILSRPFGAGALGFIAPVTSLEEKYTLSIKSSRERIGARAV